MSESDTKQADGSTHGKWTPSITIEQAQALTADEAKAVLIAWAAVQNRAKHANQRLPDIIALRVREEKDGWDVYIQYGPQATPGYFSDVFVSADWKSVRVRMGA